MRSTPPATRRAGPLFRRRLSLVPCVLVWLAAAPALAQEGGGGNTAVIAQECVSCHGSTAVGRRIPPLWGLDQGSILAAMEAFRSGSRDNPAMMSIARNLSEQQLIDIARYFSQQAVGGN